MRRTRPSPRPRPEILQKIDAAKKDEVRRPTVSVQPVLDCLNIDIEVLRELVLSAERLAGIMQSTDINVGIPGGGRAYVLHTLGIMPTPILESKSDEHSFVYSENDHLKNDTQQSYLERALTFSRECKRLRRESALTIMFAATSLWRSRSSLRATQAALAIRAPERRSNG